MPRRPGVQFLALVALMFRAVDCSSRDETSLFEVQINDLSHLNPTIYNGTCCQGTADEQGRCPLGSMCNTYFRVCLQEYRRNAAPEYRNCTLGEAISEVVPGFGGKINSKDRKVTISVPIYHRWTETFTLVLDVLHRDPSVLDTHQDPLIDRVSYKANLTSSNTFQDVESRHAKGIYDTATVLYRLRVRCADNHYTKDCSKTCYPRDDKYGHWTCDEDGERKCLSGWTDRHCEKPVCEFCDPDRSICEAPGRCACRSGWTGKNCSECVPYPNCKHGGCAQGKPLTCECERNWGGPLCDLDLDVCGRTLPCRNNGVCRNTNPDEYQCDCPVGFYGRNCQLDEITRLTYRPCDRDDGEAVCRNGGRCFETNNGTDFRCECREGWAGERCTTATTKALSCISNPCLHNGKCSQNSLGKAVCTCTHGWTGQHCQYDIDECAENKPCQHGGVCINRIGGYSCSCQSGWEGKNCTLPADSCHEYRCLNGGTCFMNSDRAGWYCGCPDGFSGRQCELRSNPCKPSPCNGGKCTPLPDGKGHKCSACPEGRYGRNCELEPGKRAETKLEYDGCLVAVSHPLSPRVEFISTKICGAHGRCVSSVDEGRRSGEFNCECDPGYTGEVCHININDCAMNPCNNGGTCLDGVNSFSCVCPGGYTGQRCEERIDACASSPCQNGECSSLDGDFVCRCSHGFKGRHCNLTNTHCDENTCQNGGTCQELGSSYLCICPPDHVGNRCQHNRRSACEATPCMNGATCVNLDNNEYQCWCPEGFDGPLCENNIDDCADATCFHNATCVDGINRFQCECLPGFTGADCRLEIDECSSNPCHAGGTCVDLINDFRCECPIGRTGRTCEVIVVNSSKQPVPSTCYYGGHRHMVGETWKEPRECSTCRCFVKGQVICERGLCEDDQCDLNASFDVCQTQSEQCISTDEEQCFLPPCRSHTECRPMKGSSLVKPLLFTPVCNPNEYSGCAAKLSLDFGDDQTGYTVESICAHIRRTMTRSTATAIAVGCVPKAAEKKLDVLIAAMDQSQTVVAALHADKLFENIRNGRTNSTILNAVQQVMYSDASQFTSTGSQRTLNSVLIGITILVFLLLLAVLLFAYKMYTQRNSIPSKAFFRDTISPTQTGMNNFRLPKMNNLSSQELTDCSSGGGKVLNTMRSIEELREYNFKVESKGRIGKAVDIPQVPSKTNNVDEFCEKNGSSNLGEVVWC